MNFSLPARVSKPNMPKGGWVYIYGDGGVGKSTLASTFPRPLFIHLEPRLEHIACYKLPIEPLQSIDQVRSLVRWVSTRYSEIQSNFDYIVIDSWSRLYEFAMVSVVQRERSKDSKIDNVWDIGTHGKGWGLVNKSAQETLQSFAQIGLPLVIIGHEERTLNSDGIVTESKLLITNTNLQFDTNMKAPA